MAEPLDLGDQINAQIRATGPMSISTYMRLCLTHPTLGYYKKADPLGAKGDFVTAPEISQLFGEMIGIWLANTWTSLGAPKAFDLVELGPGRGTLLADALRVIKNVPGMIDAMRLALVETNPALIEKQKNLLTPFTPIWVTELSQLDDHTTPILMVANEFFDALPIRQFIKKDGTWHERLIGLEGDKRQYGLSPTPLHTELIPDQMKDSSDGAIFEQSLLSQDVISTISDKLQNRSGALLAIDYGYTQTQIGDTFQAIENHQFADPLANPGKADLTAHVDFESLAKAATHTTGTDQNTLTQAAFLKAMGIVERTESLKAKNPDHAANLETDLNRLIGDTEMGSLFKCLCISSEGLNPYPFAAEVG